MIDSFQNPVPDLPEKVETKYFDVLDGSNKFNKLIGKNRLLYFTDEIHLSKEGEKLLSESICQSLIKNIDFDEKIGPSFKKTEKEYLSENQYIVSMEIL